eukprot:TRINITY_DN455_c0_g1_i1.p3 TRINITY_DN455_c0_g1~~TRINITY_DN455_c0_g1_i1.p3  ORF type:complete len:103 (-),score=1.53 TRINITY_DN455_c0_g1_i1:802-1110(-)
MIYPRYDKNLQDYPNISVKACLFLPSFLLISSTHVPDCHPGKRMTTRQIDKRILLKKKEKNKNKSKKNPQVFLSPSPLPKKPNPPFGGGERQMDIEKREKRI